MIRKVTNNIDRRITKVVGQLDKLPSLAHREFKRVTPIDTGNARRSTKLNGDSIEADYDYSVRLNTGYSRQAPNGMTDPTIEYVRNQIKKL